MREVVAIPSKDDRLCEHFGHCSHFVFYTIENGIVTDKKKLVPPPHEPGVLPKWIAQQGATHVLAGGMGKHAVTLLNQANVEVCIGVQELPVDQLVESWIQKTIQIGSNACNH